MGALTAFVRAPSGLQDAPLTSTERRRSGVQEVSLILVGVSPLGPARRRAGGVAQICAMLMLVCLKQSSCP